MHFGQKTARRLGGRLAACLLALAPTGALAASAPFDLQGPPLRVTVTRAAKTLPIAETPDLAEGDSLWIKADLPRTQSVRYLLVAAFLRGVTNPPPRNWFFASRTWEPKDADGLHIVVPAGARQVLVFLAPATGGDLRALVDAVRARPGAFVRASQDLIQASLDHARLAEFVAAIRAVDRNDPTRLKATSPLLARSLSIKLNTDCLTESVESQASCLTKGEDSLILNDGQSTSIVQSLSSGYSADLMQQLSATRSAGSGYFSPYIASVLDIVRLLDSVHTAHFQYLPALGSPSGDRLGLLLNAAPSFANPKSVVVVALPAIQAPQPPPLHAVEPEAAACLEDPGLVLPAEGAPLVFSTAYAHDLSLRLETKDGTPVDLPVKAVAERGGLVVDPVGLDPAEFGDAVKATLHGEWGFQPWQGPAFPLRNARPRTWRVASDDEQELIAGRESVVDLRANTNGCVKSVTLQSGTGTPVPLTWKRAGSEALLVTASLKDVEPGPAILRVQSFGTDMPDSLPVTIYAAASRPKSFTYHAGDSTGLLEGGQLAEVTSVDMDGVRFTPGPADAGPTGDRLTVSAGASGATAKLVTGLRATAKVRLKDGRTLRLATVVSAPRPKVTLIAKSVQPARADDQMRIQLSNPDDAPRDAVLTFSIRAEGATTFSGTDKVEVATNQNGVSATLAAADGGVVVENPHIAVAKLDLRKAFGPSAFGPLRFRLLNSDGAGDWQPLGGMVRLPAIRKLRCPVARDQPCRLTGADLFLIDSISSGSGFGDAVQVPGGFTGDTLQVPHPKGDRLYLKLSDDTGAANILLISTHDSPAIENASR